jgi:RNA polymerase sigma factor (sigma-70 family)
VQFRFPPAVELFSPPWEICAPSGVSSINANERIRNMPGPIDAEHLGQLLDELGPALALYAAQWTDAPDDCVQEALVELAGQTTVPDNVRAWLYRVVKHRALNAARSARRRRERETHVATCRLVTTNDSPKFDRWDALTVTEALDRLEPTEREVVVMRVWGSLTYEEIAVALSISTSTAHRNYERALENLRLALESPCPTNQNPATSN